MLHYEPAFVSALRRKVSLRYRLGAYKYFMKHPCFLSLMLVTLTVVSLALLPNALGPTQSSAQADSLDRCVTNHTAPRRFHKQVVFFSTGKCPGPGYLRVSLYRSIDPVNRADDEKVSSSFLPLRKSGRVFSRSKLASVTPPSKGCFYYFTRIIASDDNGISTMALSWPPVYLCF